MTDITRFDSLVELTAHFRNDEICREHLAQHRWGGDAVCPVCGARHCSRRSDGRYRCSNCSHNFSVTAGTIFEGTKVSLRLWFIAMYLISSHKKGISSHQLARDLSVTQKTAWYMLQKIRSLYQQDDSQQFCGIVECDEVYIGGKEKWKHRSMRTPKTQGRSTKTKTPVFGMAMRARVLNAKGEEEPMTYVHSFVVPRTDGATLLPVIGQFVAEGSIVMTDELSAYGGLDAEGYRHLVVRHSSEEYADGDTFTNNVEGFWSHFRRMINGCYHNVSDEHLQAYIDEACFRWNTRKMAESERFDHMFFKSIGLVMPNREFVLCEKAG